MKYYILILAAGLLSLMTVSCGESAQERRAREEAEAQRVADSIARVEEAARVKLEQHRLDSIATAEKRAIRMAADSATRAELLPAFAEEKNADGSGASLYAVKNAPKSHLLNYAYLSFTVDNGSAREIFINVCYNGNDWLNIERASIEIDDTQDELSISTEQVSNNVNNNLTCSEWFTTQLNSGILDRLLEAKSVKIKLGGDESNKTITLNSKQIADMQKTVRLYRAFGG